MSKSIYPIQRKDNLVVQETKGELLVYDLNTNRAMCLNQTAALVWQLCDGNNSVSEINQNLSRQLNQKTTEEMVWLALDYLKKEKLLSNAEEVKVDFNGLTRREAIRKAGMASLAALPLIMSVVSPTAAHAQSAVCAANRGSRCLCADATQTCNGGVGPAPSSDCGGLNSPALGSTQCGANVGDPCQCRGPFTCTTIVASSNPLVYYKEGVCSGA